ncbi:uncharacterized protein LOC101891901 isoform X1 [Musca domestica]|uniref:Uncharacterized protein LOC101891901 isoform X1 n=1 Tax=Musca domestica TaxID=7370 RepID=A0ABM3V1A3_MUSDO|nr:uncharacterized protein LOC101891901 isoform X1 [Musca domestica]
MTMTARERSLAAPADQEWTPEEEIQLFYAMAGLKPVGVNKHFYIACIAERLNRDTESVWGHLRTLYNLEALDELEPLPFPNDEKEFSLPEAEFSLVLSKKRGNIVEDNSDPPSIIAVATDNTTKAQRPQLRTWIRNLLQNFPMLPSEPQSVPEVLCHWNQTALQPHRHRLLFRVTKDDAYNNHNITICCPFQFSLFISFIFHKFSYIKKYCKRRN